MKKELYLIANDIRSAHNVGAILRTADGVGAKKVYLTGYTQAPFLEKDKTEKEPTKPQKMIAKTALGAENFVDWEKKNSIKDLIKELKQQKISLIALEKNNKAEKLGEAKINFPCALILGNEIKGVEEDILNQCDKTVFLPMRGKKESLNVSVAAGVAVYQILK